MKLLHLLVILVFIGISDGRFGRRKRAVVLKSAIKWRNGEVPYEMGVTFNEDERKNLTAAFNLWQSTTCIRFRPRRRNDTNWIRIVNGNSCYSIVGMKNSPGMQRLILGTKCRFAGVIAHELGHALGMLHEFNRVDRDSHIRFNSAIDFNRKEVASEVETGGTPYDFQSISHYDLKEFPSNLHPSVADGTDPSIIGYVYHKDLSFYDTKVINIRYQCAARCPAKSCSGEAYLKPDCQCEGPAEYAQRRCKNELPDATCNFRAERNHCNLYKADMRFNCRKACNTCFKFGQHGVHRIRLLCKDFHESCSAWKRWGECESNPGYMKPKCPLSCGECTADATNQGPTTAPVPVACRDLQPSIDCHIWKRMGNCNKIRFRAWMRMHCYATCTSCAETVACRDKENINDCRSQAAAGYCDIDRYRMWMITNCFKTCSRCNGSATLAPTTTTSSTTTTTTTPTPTTTTSSTTTTTTTPTPTTTTPAPRRGGQTGGCRDSNSGCPGWARAGECQRNPSWMKNNCRLSCNNCSQPVPCQDDANQCRYWASQRECNNNPTWMLANCKLSCNRCPCVNTRSDCPETSTSCNQPWHYRYCRRSCNFCVVCRDRRTDCAQLARRRYCLYARVISECPYSCHACP